MRINARVLGGLVLGYSALLTGLVAYMFNLACLFETKRVQYTQIIYVTSKADDQQKVYTLQVGLQINKLIKMLRQCSFHVGQSRNGGPAFHID